MCKALDKESTNLREDENPQEGLEYENPEGQKKTLEEITREDLYAGFKVLLRYLGHYRREIVTLSIMGVVSAVGNGTVPYIAGKFFDTIVSPAVFDFFGFVTPLFVAILLLWSAIQLVTYVLDWRINVLSEYFANAVYLDYLSNGFSHLLFLPASFHKKNKMGEIGNKINMAASSLEIIVGKIIIDLAPQILSIVIALVIAFYMKPLLAIFLIIGLVMYLMILSHQIKPLASYQKDYYDFLSRTFWGDAYDAIGNTIAIKQATAEEHQRDKLVKNAKIALPLWIRMTTVWGTLNFYQRITILATQIIIFALSVFYIRASMMTVGELIAFNAYAAMIFGPFVTIARNWQTIQNGIVNINETEKILLVEQEIYEPKNAPNIDIRGDIEFDGVFFTYDEGKTILSDVSFKAKAGEVVALVGESGVGKSTLIELISGYYFADTGQVKIDGHDIKALNLRCLRQKIAVVPQEVVLFNDTIETNIRYGNFDANEEDVRNAAHKAHAVDFIEKFPNKWQQTVGERGVKLSVGQKQRVAIARAILRNPSILILDEPTSALDAGTEKIITEALEELMRGKTTFVIAHRLSTVRKANNILVFKEGRIIENGTHMTLLSIEDGEYRRLYELQIGLSE